MKTYEYTGAAFTEPRSHPWSDTVGNPECRYYDLTAAPEHIRRSLEDFCPWNHYAAIEEFYALLAALNQPHSALETNDCAFAGPEANEAPSFRKALQCSGRLMVLFRELVRNTVVREVEWLTYQLHSRLANLDPDLEWGVIGTTTIPVRYLTLSKRGDQQLGSQLMISFWAWGNTEAETMMNLGRLMKSLSLALRDVSEEASSSGH